MESPQSNSPRPQRRSKAPIIWVAVLSFLGFADAAYLTVDHYLQLPVPCSLAHGCETVLTSAYSTVAGIPVSLLGVLYYLFILGLAIELFTSPAPRRRIARLIMLITTIGLITSGYLFYLQADVIHAFCQYCLGSATTTLFLFITSIFLLRSFRHRPS